MSPFAHYAMRVGLLAGCLIGLDRPAQAAPAYTVTILGSDNVAGIDTVRAINAWGQVSGYSAQTAVAGNHALLWTPTSPNASTGTFHDLSLDPGFPAGTAASQATALNDRGEVAGSAYTPGHGDGNQTQSWLWRPAPLNTTGGVLNGTHGHAVTFPLVSIPGYGVLSEYPQGMNAAGQIVGYGSYYHLVLFTPSVKNGLTGTWAYEPAISSIPAGINGAEQIAGGTSFYPYLHQGPPPLSPSDFIDSALWDHTPYETIGDATGLNALGHLAITAVNKSPRELRAYLYRNHRVIDVSGGGLMTNSAGINRSDGIVGAGATGHAYLASAGVTSDINTLIPPATPPASWLMTSAVAINDAGQIICQGSYSNGNGSSSVGFLLTPAAIDATRQFAIAPGPTTRTKFGWSQVLTLQNRGGRLPQPLSLVLDDLPAGVTVMGAAGNVRFAGTSGSPYVNAGLGPAAATHGLLTIRLNFSAPAFVPLGYTPRILAGPAPR